MHGARVAWMGEVCPARLMTGSNFSPPNFQVLTPVSSPPEKRNSPVCHGTLVVTPSQAVCGATVPVRGTRYVRYARGWYAYGARIVVPHPGAYCPARYGHGTAYMYMHMCMCMCMCMC